LVESNEFIREVDEEYRRDRIAQIWKRYNGLIVGLAVLVVATVGGWRYWQHLERTRAEDAAARYQEALRLDQEGKGDDAAQVLRSLTSDQAAGYRLLARFRLAGEAGQQNPDEGARAFDALAADGAAARPAGPRATPRGNVPPRYGRFHRPARPRAAGDAHQRLAPYRA
jgi:hypothetical protein